MSRSLVPRDLEVLGLAVPRKLGSSRPAPDCSAWMDEGTSFGQGRPLSLALVRSSRRYRSPLRFAPVSAAGRRPAVPPRDATSQNDAEFRVGRRPQAGATLITDSRTGRGNCNFA